MKKQRGNQIDANVPSPSVKIAICGAGALGSNLAENLTRMGIGTLKVIDKDRVELKNVATQAYSRQDIGKMKVAALQAKLYDSCGSEVEIVAKELTQSSVKRFLAGSNLIVDCFDNSKSRLIVQNFARERAIKCLHVGLFDGYGEVKWDERYVVPSDPDEGDPCERSFSRNLVMLAVVVASESIIRWMSEGAQDSYSITMKDLKVILIP